MERQFRTIAMFVFVVLLVNASLSQGNRPSAGRRATATATAWGGTRFTVARDAVNVRAGPGTNYAVIGQVTRGQQFTATGRNQAGDWLRFDLDGQTGWVYAPLMTVHCLGGR